MSDERCRTFVLRAYAKVNLTLEVLGRRPDGFHEVRTVLQSISLADRLTLNAAPDFAFSCEDPALAGQDNLVVRAVLLLRERAGGSPGAHLHLEKGIPVAAGLGGGSADAAAALVGLDRLWGLGLPDEDLLPLAEELGSDVPFFLRGGTALASGRGERLESLPSLGLRWLVLLIPPTLLPNKTARLYQSLSPADYGDGLASNALAAVLWAGTPIAPDLLINSFTHAASRRFPELERYARALSDAGAASVHLSGSGPSLFTLVDSEERSRELAGRLVRGGYAPLVAHTVPRGWELLSDG